MRYRKFGRTGIEISDIAPGLWGMGGWSGSDDTQSLEALQLSVDLGCNFFDTAWAYGEGKSDGLLGQTIAKNKGKRLYAASKIPRKNERWPAQPSYKYHDVFPPDHVFKYANGSANSSQPIPSTFFNSTSGRTNGPTSLISVRRWRNSNVMASSAISG
ncbi:MAG: aldo/keto reductase [Terriglobales bacterium]|jgi:aryl-alcohol dehydrogenase-like predicted oxidoreductase